MARNGPPRLAESSARRVARTIEHMPYIYILKSINHPKTYVGSTADLERRSKEHNSNQCIFTKKYSPWKIMHKEEFPDIQKARKKEKYYESASGRRFIKNILVNKI